MAIYTALFFTVALLVATAYFLMGGLPLLVLQHDTPLDARFIRGFFNVYFLAAKITATGTAISYGFMGRLDFAAGAAALALLAFAVQKTVLPRMDQLREQIRADDTAAVQRFRKIHLSLLMSNLAQLVLVVWSLTTLKL